VLFPLLPLLLPGLSGRFQLFVALCENLFVPAFQFVLGGDVAERAVQPFFVVVADVVRNLGSRLFERKGHLGPNALVLDGFVITLQLAVALRIRGRRPYMRHASHPDELFEILGNELRAVVGNDPWCGVGKFLPGPLQNDLHVFLAHRLAQLPVDDIAAASVKDAAQVIESAAEIDVSNIDMPMLMGLQRLHKTGPLLGCFTVPAPQQIGGAQDTINATGADGNHIAIEHHKGQASVAFQRMLQEKADNGPLLPVFEPEVTGNQGVMLIGLTVAILPVIILAGSVAQPGDKTRHSDAGALSPALDEVNDHIANIVGNPGRL